VGRRNAGKFPKKHPNTPGWAMDIVEKELHSNFPVSQDPPIPRPLSAKDRVKDLQRSQSVASEKAILVSVAPPHQQFPGDPLEELTGLVTTAGAAIVGRLYQNRDKPDPATYLGKGKVEELARLVELTEADLLVFDNDLSPAQTRNLEQATKIKALDRTELILDIFATHARTHEARLAVELAQLEYSLPRLKRMWTHLSRIKMGVGMRGPGEKQLEEDRRLVERRIHDLKQDVQAIERRKARQVASRRDHMTVSLVGYTNAGKSTLMNALTGAGVLTADKLFATLDTRTRRWRLPGWGPVLLSDTVGFIRDLPHRLVTSFRATLEEARQADLLMHVADASNSDVYQQVSAVYRVLEELEIEAKDTLLVLNKVDAVAGPGVIEGILNRFPNALPVSAVSGEGLTDLAQLVSDALADSFADVDIEFDVADGRRMAQLASCGEVLSKRFDGARVTFHVRVPHRHLGRVTDGEAVLVRPHDYDGAAPERPVILPEYKTDVESASPTYEEHVA